MAALVLSDAERDQLTRWARRPKSSQALALRSRIVLACAKGTPSLEVAARLGVHGEVRRWPVETLVERNRSGAIGCLIDTPCHRFYRRCPLWLAEVEPPDALREHVGGDHAQYLQLKDRRIRAQAPAGAA